MTKVKVKMGERRSRFIKYEIYEGKTKVNEGWWKITTEKTTGEMAKNVEHMYYNKL